MNFIKRFPWKCFYARDFKFYSNKKRSADQEIAYNGILHQGWFSFMKVKVLVNIIPGVFFWGGGGRGDT